jgi:hypothetical protein
VYRALTPAEAGPPPAAHEARTQDAPGLVLLAPPPPAPEPPEPPLPGPARLDCRGENGVSHAEVQEAQAAWAKYLGRRVEEEDEVAPGVLMAFVLVPPGQFLMGSPQAEVGRNPRKEGFDAEAQHPVRITRPGG